MPALTDADVRVHVTWDDAPYEWGDIDPTPDERANLEVFAVEIEVREECAHPCTHCAAEDTYTTVDALHGIGVDNRTTWVTPGTYTLADVRGWSTDYNGPRAGDAYLRGVVAELLPDGATVDPR